VNNRLRVVFAMGWKTQDESMPCLMASLRRKLYASVSHEGCPVPKYETDVCVCCGRQCGIAELTLKLKAVIL
jgi:hypothetical protein